MGSMPLCNSKGGDLFSYLPCFLISHAVSEFRILVLNRACTPGVVYYCQIGIGLCCRKSHQPPSVVGRHVEAEGSREVAGCGIMETHKRLAESAGVRI